MEHHCGGGGVGCWHHCSGGGVVGGHLLQRSQYIHTVGMIGDELLAPSSSP